MASKFTKYELEEVTDYVGFESFCHALMSRLDFPNIEPLAGTNDKGRDAVHVSRTTGEVTIFAYSVREDWARKLFEDLGRIQRYGHSCDQVVFVTTGQPTTREKDNLKRRVSEEFGWRLEIYDLERLATLVDNQYIDLKELHPNIFVLSTRADSAVRPSILDRRMYAKSLLQAHQEWIERYTPLLAEHRELDAFVVPVELPDTDRAGIPVTSIPQATRMAIILGESGSGKTTALWRIAVERSRALVAGEEAELPILVGLRGWTPTSRCRDLVLHEFISANTPKAAIESELRAGRCLILIDGLNELPPSETVRHQARNDLQRFLVEYANNRFVICCRSSDYEPRLLDLEQLRLKLPEPKVFEIRRLDKEQVGDYIQRHFRDAPDKGDRLLHDLGYDGDAAWRNSASILTLVRIPLYLQLLVSDFRRRGEVPRNKADLLRGLIQRTLDREPVRQAARVDRRAKEGLIGAIAYKAVREGYLLRVPHRHARLLLGQESLRLKGLGLIHGELTVETLWRELLSNNLWHEVGDKWVEWIHQLIVDYFLACEIARIRTEGNPRETLELHQLINRSVWEQPCIIALSLLDGVQGARFLVDLLKTDTRIAQLAFDNVDEGDAREIADCLFSEGRESPSAFGERLRSVALALPYLSVVQRLGTCFRELGHPIRQEIAEAVSAMVMKYYPLLVQEVRDRVRYYDDRQAIEMLDRGRIKIGVNRGLELLTAWSANSNDHVRFHAAKGIWETDRGRASEVFRALLTRGREGEGEAFDGSMEYQLM